jgi:hypothetical protein
VIQNVIVLTSGLSGSSVLTSLVAKAGYWTGETHKKHDYDTYENTELLDLNLKILAPAGSKSTLDLVKAIAIYLKNYSERINLIPSDDRERSGRRFTQQSQ